MSTKARRFVSAAFLGGALLGAALLGSRASSSTPADTDFHKAYPRTPVASGSFAGVALDKLAFPGLTLSDREDHPVDEGGIVLAYSQGNAVRLVVKVAVAPDSARARELVDVELHGVQTVLPAAVDPAFGDYAFADDAGRGDALAVGALGNVAWSVRVDRDAPSMPRASDVMHTLRANVVSGAPSYPTVHVSLPGEVRVSGADITVSSSLPAKLRAEGAYVAVGPKLRPFGPGPVAVIALVVDDLGRVSTARASAAAK